MTNAKLILTSWQLRMSSGDSHFDKPIGGLFQLSVSQSVSQSVSLIKNSPPSLCSLIFTTSCNLHCWTIRNTTKTLTSRHWSVKTGLNINFFPHIIEKQPVSNGVTQRFRSLTKTTRKRWRERRELEWIFYSNLRKKTRMSNICLPNEYVLGWVALIFALMAFSFCQFHP